MVPTRALKGGTQGKNPGLIEGLANPLHARWQAVGKTAGLSKCAQPEIVHRAGEVGG